MLSDLFFSRHQMFHFYRFHSTSFLCFLGLILAACESVHDPTVKEVAGEYIYEYKSGQIEVWILKGDLSYRQEFFNDVRGYSEHAPPRYANSGNWSLKKNKITLEQTLNFFDYGNLDRALDAPLHVVAQPADWLPPSGSDDAKISIGMDIDYVLRRVNRKQ
jgi:hypothetical protein